MIIQYKEKVLIVDDSEENRLILEEICTSLGYISLMATNGKEALESLNKELPSIILLDIEMPEMNGIDFLGNIKTNLKWKEIPVLMVSALDDNSSIVKCLKLGADDYITKPFEPDIMQARIQNALARVKAKIVEKELLEKTFAGSAKILSDILVLLSPQLFGKTSKIRRYSKIIADELKYPEPWEIDVAALFCLIGAITIDSDIIDKIINGKTLNVEEKTIFESHPAVGFKLLNNIPRLQNVAQVVKYQNKNYDGSGFPYDEKLSRTNLPLGSRILRAAFEFEILSSKGLNPMELSHQLELKKYILDPVIINIIDNFIIKQNNNFAELTISNLKPGMIFGQDVYTVSGSKVIGQWQEATDAFLERIDQINSKSKIKEPIKMLITKI